ncbi:hypothetical protein FK178_07350 [Antarcticibacterium arcticum]|uniref:Uncharacterized protein n=1 Tax=Antarcticibacterium arcticum TaxID=2585771 RepID=A0A5B8YHY8_9FLAO|nr:hypothetical protein [Antarcticibacterium arcticum]QED37552.1 hypothetical protein FK178_07350 [Antarcticibacterium arcticum]
MKKQFYLLALSLGLIGCSVESNDSAEQLLTANAEFEILQSYEGITNPGFEVNFYDLVQKHKNDPTKDVTLGRVFISNDCTNLLVKIEGTDVGNLGLYGSQEEFPAKNGSNENVDGNSLEFNETTTPSLYWEFPLADLGEEVFVFVNAGDKSWGGDTSWGNALYFKYTIDVTSCADACTNGMGWWKINFELWPGAGKNLGNVYYTNEQLLAILNSPVKGNGLMSLSHHLIATKLNIANGSNPTDVAAAVQAADALIGNVNVFTGNIKTNLVGSIKEALENYNNGITGPGNCEETEE